MVDKKRPLTVVPVRIGIQSGVVEGKSRYFPKNFFFRIYLEWCRWALSRGVRPRGAE